MLKGFEYNLTKLEEEIILSFNQYNEFHLLEYAIKEKHTSNEASAVIKSLMTKSIIKFDKVYKLTNKGIQLRIHLNAKT